ncbi:MAG: hypothetical protein AMJ63_16865 [Myxococcales bacterium SG8_38_1]|nr:MAG: hypothetical protein AMJ63_16865 [Myxococcales bacterium SG8_38_1]
MTCSYLGRRLSKAPTEAKVVRDEALHALEILRVDALEDLLKELGQGGGLFQDVLGGHCALPGGF